MKQFKYIGNIDERDLEENVVHACINEHGFRCILIKNSEEKTVQSKYDTDNLEIKLNSVLSFVDNGYFFHIITSKRNDAESNEGFELVYDYIFKKIQHPIADSELAGLVLSLEEYFRITPERDNRKLQVGVWGELFTIKNLYSNGYKEILEKYHDNFYLKHDVEINSKTRIEIKTSTNQNRIHHFSHDQICRKDVNVYVVSLILEEAQAGVTLWEMFKHVIGLLQSPDSIFSMQKLMKMCGVSEEKQGLSFSEEKAKQDIRFYDAKVLPMIQGDIPQGVTKIEYDVDCALSEFISESAFISKITD